MASICRRCVDPGTFGSPVWRPRQCAACLTTLPPTDLTGPHHLGFRMDRHPKAFPKVPPASRRRLRGHASPRRRPSAARSEHRQADVHPGSARGRRSRRRPGHRRDWLGRRCPRRLRGHSGQPARRPAPAATQLRWRHCSGRDRHADPAFQQDPGRPGGPPGAPREPGTSARQRAHACGHRRCRVGRHRDPHPGAGRHLDSARPADREGRQGRRGGTPRRVPDRVLRRRGRVRHRAGPGPRPGLPDARGGRHLAAHHRDQLRGVAGRTLSGTWRWTGPSSSCSPSPPSPERSGVNA